MYTQAKYQYQINNQKAIKFVLPANLQDKYRQYSQQTKQFLKSTEKCPFTSIRQLIIAFKTTGKASTDLQKSDILRQRYLENTQLQKIDSQLNNLIQKNQLSQIRNKKLLACIKQYNRLYGYCQKNAQNYVPDTNPVFSYFGAPEIEHNKKNRSFLQKQSNYFHFLSYSNELQRALVLGGLSHPQLFKARPNPPAGIDNFRVFQDYYCRNVDIEKQLEQNSQNLLHLLIEWRMKVKQGTAQAQEIENLKNRCQQTLTRIDGMISTMQKFPEWLVSDRQYVRRIYEADTRKYKQFLNQYTEQKQKHEITQKKSFLNQIIKGQKEKLQAHLRKNFGLIVPYTPSDQFEKMITPVKNNSRFRDLLSTQLKPLQQAFIYINQQYQKLYRNACDNGDPSRLRGKIEQNKIKFERYLQNGQDPYYTHLIQSCGRLLQIVR